MEHDWKKLHSNQQWPPKTVMRQIWRVILKGGGHTLWEAVWHPYTICLVKIFTWIDKVNVINNSAQIIWFFAVENSINAYLTEK